MTHTIHATPIVEGEFWIVEQDGEKIGTLHKKENNKFMLNAKNGSSYFSERSELLKAFGKDFFNDKIKTTISKGAEWEVHGYPAKCFPDNPVFDVKKRLPLFTKSRGSKSVYCAGYFIIKFGKGWVKIFCPKLVTVARYETRGPFKTELELRQAMIDVKSN